MWMGDRQCGDNQFLQWVTDRLAAEGTALLMVWDMLVAVSQACGMAQGANRRVKRDGGCWVSCACEKAGQSMSEVGNGKREEEE